MRLAAIAFFLVCVWSAQAQFMFNPLSIGHVYEDNLTTSLAAYQAASQNDVILITQDERDAIAANMVASANDTPPYPFDAVTSASINFTWNIANKTHIPESDRYLVAFSLEVFNNNDPSTGATVPAVGTLYMSDVLESVYSPVLNFDIPAGNLGKSILHYIVKDPTIKTDTYIAFSSDSDTKSLQYFNEDDSNVAHIQNGSQGDLTSPTGWNRYFKMQFLTTSLKQW